MGWHRVGDKPVYTIGALFSGAMVRLEAKKIDLFKAAIPGEQGKKLKQKHGCWWPGFVSRHAINKYDVDYLGLTSSYFPWGRTLTSWAISVSGNDSKCKLFFLIWIYVLNFQWEQKHILFHSSTLTWHS